MPNDYYDFNPSATTWALMLGGVVLFVLALCVLLIVAIQRSEATAVTARTEQQEDEPLRASSALPHTTAASARAFPAS
jgi:hypothetical protein